jgi:hypothetical protein
MSESNLSDPSAILRRVATTYADCATYEDHGVVETRFHPGMPQEAVSKIWFTTYFRRPNLFRFAFMTRMMEGLSGSDLTHVIWSDGKTTHFKTPLWPFSGQSDLSTAIAGATGISSGSAIRVPQLLIKDLAIGNTLTAIKKPRHLAVESTDSEMCDRIDHETLNSQTDYWISQSRSIVLQVLERSTIGPDMIAAQDKDRSSIQSFTGLINWGTKKMMTSLMANMDPFLVTKRTQYRKVVLNGQIADGVFSETGRA